MANEEEEEKSTNRGSGSGSGNDEDEAEDEDGDSDEDDEDENVFYRPSDLIYQSKYDLRKWLRKTGKDKYIDFTDKQQAILQDCFNELDDDGSQAIGVDELEDPFMALGLVDSRKQVEMMVREIDEDGNIEFEEFLQLVKGGDKTKATLLKHCNKDENNDIDVIFDFFKKLSNDELSSNKDMKIGFSIYFTQERRKKILEAILSGGKNNMTVEGKRMIGKYADQVDNQIKRLKEEREEMQA